MLDACRREKSSLDPWNWSHRVSGTRPQPSAKAASALRHQAGSPVMESGVTWGAFSRSFGKIISCLECHALTELKNNDNNGRKYLRAEYIVQQLPEFLPSVSKGLMRPPNRNISNRKKAESSTGDPLQRSLWGGSKDRSAEWGLWLM